MPVMANITVKKADNVTDIVYDQLGGSGGDSSPAIWRQDTGAAAGLPVGLRSMLKVQTSWNGPKTARQLKLSFSAPYAVQDTTTTLYQSKDRVVGEVFLTIPQAIPATNINEATAQMLHLCAAALIKASAASGYAPT